MAGGSAVGGAAAAALSQLHAQAIAHSLHERPPQHAYSTKTHHNYTQLIVLLLGFRVLGFRVEGLGLRVLGFRVL